MKRIVRRAVLLGVLIGAPCAVAPSRARAEAHRDLDYSYDQVWNTLVRLVRVDYRFTIDERDDATGFLLFQYRDHGRTHAASLELVRAPGHGSDASGAGGGGRRERVRLVVNIEAMPNRAEARVLDDLVAKLRSDYGPPPPVAADATVDGAAGVRPRLRPAPSRIPTSDVPPGAADVTPPSVSPPTTTATNAGSTAVAPVQLTPASTPSSSGTSVDRRVYRTTGAPAPNTTSGVRDSGFVPGVDVRSESDARASGASGASGTSDPRPRAQARGVRGDGARDGVRPSAGPERESPADAPRILLR